MGDIRVAARSILASTPIRWASIAETVPDELLRREPAAGQWSALACLGHLVDTEREVFPIRLRAFLAGRDFESFDPEAARTRTGPLEDPRAVAGDLARLRAANLEMLAGIRDEDLARTARHATLGPATLREMLNQWAAHDLNHTVQAERALMQAFIAGSGPWRHFFVDHDLAPESDPTGRPRD